MDLKSPVKRPKNITVSHFFKTYGEMLKLELVEGSRGINRVVREGTVHRPALALTGFYKYLSNKGLQVLGAAEVTYLRSFDSEAQYHYLYELAKRTIPCLILTRNFVPTKAMLKVCRERNLPLFRTPLITKHFINAATVFLEYEFAPKTTEHGTLLDIKGVGTLIRGKSGVGKSECALALIERGHSLVADDITYISLLNERDPIGRSAELNRGYMECRGLGILNIGHMFGIRSVRLEKRIDYVITFKEWDPDAEEDRTGLDQKFYKILGISLPETELLVRPGRDMARLVEVAALGQALKMMGHDSAKEFNDRLIAHMTGKNHTR